MTLKEIAMRAELLRKNQLAISDPSMSNYRSVLKQYKEILNDTLVMIRELAENLEPAAVEQEVRLHLTDEIRNGD